jgi:hypothetical protein
VSVIPAIGKDVGNHTPKTYPHPAAADAPGIRAKTAPDTSRDKTARFDEIMKRAKQIGARRSSPPSDGQADSNDGLVPMDSRNLSQWFRAETPPDAIRPVRPPLRIGPHQRVLVSSAGTASHARIEISSGRMAGSHIQITATSRGLDAQLLTGNEASRQTLVAAMDAVRERLRVRGVLLASAVTRRAPAQDARDGRPAARPGGGDECSGGSQR